MKESSLYTTALSENDLLRTKAMHVVSRLVSTGAIPPATSLKCVDCGKKAVLYDHRDYRRPKKVSALCKGCNNRRGPGLPFLSEKDALQRKHPWRIKNGKKSGNSAGYKWDGLSGGIGYAPNESGNGASLEREDSRDNYQRERNHGLVWEHRETREDFFKKRDPWAL